MRKKNQENKAGRSELELGRQSAIFHRRKKQNIVSCAVSRDSGCELFALAAAL